MGEREWGIASYTLVGTAVLLAGGYIASRCGVEGTTIASWVQAIGSMGAIWGAFAIGARQTEQVRIQADTAAKQREKEAIEGALHLAEKLERICGASLLAAVTQHKRDGTGDISPKLLNRLCTPLAAQLNAIPMHLPPYSRIAEDLIGIVATCTYFIDAAETLAQSEGEVAKSALALLSTWHVNMLDTVNVIRRKEGLTTIERIATGG